MTDFESLGDALQTLEANAESASRMTAVFNDEMQNMRAGMGLSADTVKSLNTGMQKGLKKAVDGLVQDGDTLSDALRTVFSKAMDAVYDSAVTPVTDQLGSMLTLGLGKLVGGLMPFEKGGSFVQGRVMPFAKGGVISGPTTFPMRGGMGLMGEAGPEAIMPLARGADGSLGVRASTGRAVNVVMNITTPDVESFRRSQGQIATQMSRALGRAGRNR